MIIKSTTFIKSSTKLKDCPPFNKPEYAFIGRSNVGKSSLVNMLTGNGKLAKVSGRPGKTQTINHFLINENWYLVDLPGYGWARISDSQRKEWKVMIDNYLYNRENLMVIFVLIDSRIPPQKIDVEFVNHLGENGIPFVLVFTKADKQSRVKTDQAVANFKNALKETFEEMPDIFITSSETDLGKEDILSYIERVNNLFVIPPDKQIIE